MQVQICYNVEVKLVGPRYAGIVNGHGPQPCDIMIIGEAPGANEAETGLPFVGASGKILSQALEEAGLPRESVYITNVYKYRPPNNRAPNDEEIAAHMPILFSEIHDVQPKHILLLGNTPLYAFTKKKGISAVHGTRVAYANHRYVFCTYHPAATLYNKTTKADFFNDVKTFAKIARGEYIIAGLGSTN